VLKKTTIEDKEAVNFHHKGVDGMSVKDAKVCAVTDSRLLGTLTGEAEFSCARCGATAHAKENVCEPIPLEPDH
jgi:hypothetical protein